MFEAMFETMFEKKFETTLKTTLEISLSYFNSHYVGLIHTAVAVLALILGWRVIARPKGTKTHKTLGYCYVLLMLALNGTALFIHSLFVFGPFHIAALISLTSICVGVLAPILKIPNAINVHYECMSWSYVGLWAAFFSEAVTRLPWVVGGAAFASSVILASLVTCLVGGTIIYRRRPQWSHAAVSNNVRA